MNWRTRQKHSNRLWKWYEKERELPYIPNYVVYCLKWFAKHDPEPEYTYTGNWYGHLEYCSDRMNGGRAKAILRLMREERIW